MAAISTFTDDFTTADAAKWSGYGASIAVSSGRVVVTPSGSYPALTSVDSYDLTGSTAHVEVVQTTNNSGNAACYFILQQAANNLIFFRVEGGNLVTQYRFGSDVIRTTVAYSSTNHRWWRIRETGGSVFWDTSPDASTWTQIGTGWTPLFAITALKVQFVSGFGSGTPGTAIYDNLNLTPGAAPTPALFFLASA